jgi:hypothetical protein
MLQGSGTGFRMSNYQSDEAEHIVIELV